MLFNNWIWNGCKDQERNEGIAKCRWKIKTEISCCEKRGSINAKRAKRNDGEFSSIATIPTFRLGRESLGLARQTGWGAFNLIWCLRVWDSEICSFLYLSQKRSSVINGSITWVYATLLIVKYGFKIGILHSMMEGSYFSSLTGRMNKYTWHEWMCKNIIQIYNHLWKNKIELR